MTASDHALQRRQRFPLPERGRPQMNRRENDERGRAFSSLWQERCRRFGGGTGL